MSKKVRRLYEQFVPEHYQLHIVPDSDNLVFRGTVTIRGRKVGRPSERLTFHQNELKITAASLTIHDKQGDTSIEVSRINTHDSYDEVRIHSDSALYPGSYTVSLDFEGKITDNMTGLYPCYFEHDGTKKKLLATQFESHHAREVFPCIDEPEAKATFDLTLTTKMGEEVLSNTLVKSQETTEDGLVTLFETTPIMSTYLLAFVTGEMHYVERHTKDGIAIRSWASVAQPKQFLEFSADEGAKILDFFTDYFDTPFPLKKCDQVALPDFESGAMENWGLVTYREVAMLTDPDNRSVSGEHYVAMVVAHELSHQWFGNLVTMKWWDDLWLNESFASLMEHIALARLHPEWHQWEQYAATDIIACSNRDIYTSVQSVKVPVHHPDEIHALFDPAIVYAKGGRLLKMMHDFIGEADFRAGLKTYFAKHAYKNTTRDDLWTEMSASSGKNINALMDPWLEQSGMPVVKVSPDSSTSRKIEQSRFALDSDNDPSLWPIPLLANKPTEPQLFEVKETILSFSGDLPVLNATGSGHYVTHYTSDDDLQQFINGITSGSIKSEARINFLNDLILLARRGDDSLTDALSLVKALKNEPREPVWMMMTRVLGLAGNIIEGNKVVEDRLKKFRYELAHEQYANLGWNDNEDDEPNTKLLRAIIIGLMLGSEYQPIIDHALSVYKEAKSIDDIPADRRGAVLGAVVRHGKSQKDINDLIELYKTTPNPDLQHSICGALTFTKDPELTKRLITEGLSEGGFVRPQDSFRWFAYLMRSQYTRNQAWEWLTDNWEYLSEKVGKKSLDHWVVYSSAPLQTTEWEAKFKTFFEPKKDIVSIARNIEIAYAEIAARVAWRNREASKIESWLNDN